MASNAQSKLLLEAAQRYAQEISPEALAALGERGISEVVAARYMLGTVTDPMNGHEMQEGNFAYLKDTNVTTYYTGSAWANLDTTGMTNPMTTTGDTIYSSSGSTPARLGIGSTDHTNRNAYEL